MERIDIILVCLFAAPMILILLVMLVLYITDFARELRYLNDEIARTEGVDREYWVHRKRRLWLSLIPFVRY